MTDASSHPVPDQAPLFILYFEEDAAESERVHALLLRAGIPCKIVRAGTPDEFVSALEFKRFDLILSSCAAFRPAACSAVGSAKQKLPETPLIILGTLTAAKAAPHLKKMRANAYCSKSRLKSLPAIVTKLTQRHSGTSAGADDTIQVKESEELFQAIFGKSLDVIMIVDTKRWTILNANAASRRILKYDAETLFDRAFLNLVAESSPLDRDTLVRRLMHRDALSSAVEILRADGVPTPMVLTATLIPWGRHEAALVMLRDISAERASERALRESEERFRLLAEHSNDIVCLHEPTGEFLYVSPSTEKLIGYPVESLIGKNPLELLHPDDVHEVQREFRAMVQSPGKNIIVTARVLKANGGYIWLEISGQPIHDREGAVTRFVTGSRDISERKLAEDILRKSEQQYRLIVNTAREGICLLDASQRISYTNERFCSMLGYSQPELMERFFVDLIHPDSKAVIGLHFSPDHAVQTTIPDFQLLRKDGGSIWVMVSINYVRDDAGVFIGSLCMLSDITNRKLAEATVREQASLLNIADDAIYVRDMKDRITFWNQGAASIYGWTGEEVLGKEFQSLVVMDTEAYSRAIQLVLTSGSWKGELRQQSKTNRDLIIEARWTLVRNDRGEPDSILSVDTDITERKTLESQFLRAQRMESIGILAGGIAHDLSNVLAPIMMSIDLLRRDAVNETQQMMLETIQASARRGSQIIRQVLDFARGIDGRKGTLVFNHIIGEMVSIIKQTFPKSIQVKKMTAKDLWAIHGDATQLHQVLLNLCVNARDAMPAGGVLSITAHNETVDEGVALRNPEAVPGPYVVVTVSDTGTGIPPEAREKIFEPFYTTKEVGKGTGLGLATVHTIVKSHSGFIRVFSEVGQGTTFRLYFPADPASVGTDQAQGPVNAPRGHGELLLLVDDEEAIRTITGATLANNGYRVLTAADGTEALALYAQEKEHVRLVITDLLMPYMDGVATIRALRKMNSALPIIAVSGHLSEKSQIDGEDGVAAFMLKPFTAEDLLIQIDHILAPAESGTDTDIPDRARVHV